MKSTALLADRRFLETRCALFCLQAAIPRLLFAGLSLHPCAPRFLLFPRGALKRETDVVIFDDLRAIQLRHGFPPKAELESLSARTQTPLYQIHSVASFYPHFHLLPPARAEIRVCADMSCHLNGACELRADIERRFAGAQRSDVEIRDVSCLGRCDHAPAVSINDRIYTGVTAEHVESIARAAIRGEDLQEEHQQASRVECASDPYPVAEKYGVLRQLLVSKDWDGVLAKLKESELRGM